MNRLTKGLFFYPIYLAFTLVYMENFNTIFKYKYKKNSCLKARKKFIFYSLFLYDKLSLLMTVFRTID